jgi:protein SCO1/2
MTAAHVRLAVLTVAGLAVGALTALALLPQARDRLLPSPPVGGWGQALVGGPFALTDHNGRRVTDADFRGRIMLVLFGYTSCPDVCPSALQVLSAALGRLGPTAERFVPILITVDPERDTPERLRPYVERFHRRLVGLAGTPAETAAVLEAYRVKTRPRGEGLAPSSGDIEHPGRIYIMGADGRYRTYLDYTKGADAVAASLAGML